MYATNLKFSDLGEDALTAIRHHVNTRTYPKNTIIINEGDHTSSLYVILSGKLKVFVSDDSGKELILNIHGPGEYIGELSVLDDQPRSASVVTLEKSKLLVMSKDQFRDCIKQHPDLAINLLRQIAARTRALTQTLRDMALADVYTRISRLFLSLSVPDGDTRIIHPRLTQQSIANMTGASREMVARIVKDLVEGGYIIKDKHSIVIKKALPKAW